MKRNESRRKWNWSELRSDGSVLASFYCSYNAPHWLVMTLKIHSRFGFIKQSLLFPPTPPSHSAFSQSLIVWFKMRFSISSSTFSPRLLPLTKVAPPPRKIKTITSVWVATATKVAITTAVAATGWGLTLVPTSATPRLKQQSRFPPRLRRIRVIVDWNHLYVSL